MLSTTRISTTARAAILRSQVTTLKAAPQRLSSRTVSYLAAHSQDLASVTSGRCVLSPSRLPVGQLVSPFAIPLIRSFHGTTSIWQQQQQQQQKEEQKSEETKSESQGEEARGEEKEEKQEDAAPPPPHGDKSPWQVFRETLQSEFKASKEWNESTKALASSAHQFTENENIKRARAAYEAASGAASSRTSSAIKSTGRAIGRGAAWTWDTPVVRGVRKGVTATGSGIERATRPVRETEAYKSVKDAIDDGSSSRYGGWIEKDERRKQRQLREEMEAKSGKSRRMEQMAEDPK